MSFDSYYHSLVALWIKFLFMKPYHICKYMYITLRYETLQIYSQIPIR